MLQKFFKKKESNSTATQKKNALTKSKEEIPRKQSFISMAMLPEPSSSMASSTLQQKPNQSREQQESSAIPHFQQDCPVLLDSTIANTSHSLKQDDIDAKMGSLQEVTSLSIEEQQQSDEVDINSQLLKLSDTEKFTDCQVNEIFLKETTEQNDEKTSQNQETPVLSPYRLSVILRQQRYKQRLLDFYHRYDPMRIPSDEVLDRIVSSNGPPEHIMFYVIQHRYGLSIQAITAHHAEMNEGNRGSLDNNIIGTAMDITSPVQEVPFTDNKLSINHTHGPLRSSISDELNNDLVSPFTGELDVNITNTTLEDEKDREEEEQRASMPPSAWLPEWDSFVESILPDNTLKPISWNTATEAAGQNKISKFIPVDSSTEWKHEEQCIIYNGIHQVVRHKDMKVVEIQPIRILVDDTLSPYRWYRTEEMSLYPNAHPSTAIHTPICDHSDLGVNGAVNVKTCNHCQIGTLTDHDDCGANEESVREIPLTAAALRTHNNNFKRAEKLINRALNRMIRDVERGFNFSDTTKEISNLPSTSGRDVETLQRPDDISSLSSDSSCNVKSQRKEEKCISSLGSNQSVHTAKRGKNLYLPHYYGERLIPLPPSPLSFKDMNYYEDHDEIASFLTSSTACRSIPSPIEFE
eukprot:Tbor_TRINITY_DN4789_c0_g1::TRINITY_DN4789_c0_g1_i1::g.17057::m.17057